MSGFFSDEFLNFVVKVIIFGVQIMVKHLVIMLLFIFHPQLPFNCDAILGCISTNHQPYIQCARCGSVHTSSSRVPGPRVRRSRP